MKRAAFVPTWIACFGLLVAASVVSAEPKQMVVAPTPDHAKGVVSELADGALIVRSESDPTPLSYTYSKTTTYVDEDGHPVAVETVRSGVPVTVYYTQSPDGLVASKVVVRKTTADGKTTIEEKRTTIER